MRLYCILFVCVASVYLIASTVYAQTGEQRASNPFAQAKFVPDISLILDGSYVCRNHSNETFDKLILPGFSHQNAEHPEHEHEGMNSSRGFNLNYGELVLSSVVDPYFDLFVVCHLSQSAFEIEEAFFTTRRFPYGLQIKGGKFLSQFGRINGQHTHYWDFSDMPLSYAVFFGESSLNEKGLRLNWVAPIDRYLMLGWEILQGENHMSFGYDGYTDLSGVVKVAESNGPSLSVACVKTSFDADQLTILGGFSHAYGKTRLNHGIEQTGTIGEAISGTSQVVGADLTLKYLFDSIRYLTVQSEYLYRHTKGQLYLKDASDVVYKNALVRQQSGMYTQVIGQLSKRLRLGGRYDLINYNNISLDGTEQDYPQCLPRYSVMAEYNPTEFSRLRLQYNFDQSRYEATVAGFSRQRNQEVILQINLAIGAHGAHAF